MACTDVFRRCVYKDWVWCTGVTMMRWSTFSWKVFLRIQLIKRNKGKAKPYFLSQRYKKASVAILPRSCYHAIYWGSWWRSLDTDLEPVVPCVAISWKIKTFVFQFEWSLELRDSQSMWTFRAMRRYSADSVICLLRR